MSKWSTGAVLVGAALAFWAPVLRAPQPLQPPSDIKSTDRGVLLSRLEKAAAKTEDGQDLGSVKDIMIDPHAGQLRFLVIGRGGLLGVGQKRVPIPWKSVIIESDEQLAVNLSKARLGDAPTVSSDYRDLNNPGYLVSLYQYYEANSNPTAIGAPGESPGGSSTGNGNSQQNAPKFKQ